MKIELLREERIDEFFLYCRKYRDMVDESYISEEDFQDFNCEDNMTFIAVDNDKIVGVASLILTDFFTKAKKSRFRIFYCEDNNLEIYKLLFSNIIESLQNINNVFLFINEEDIETRKIFDKMGFIIERYSYLLIKDNTYLNLDLPENYYLNPFKPNQDEKKWCNVINESFKLLNGHLSDITEDMVAKLLTYDSYISGGMMLLYHNDDVIGVVSVTKDEYKNNDVAYIGPIAVIPKYQGMGLGRFLLRQSVQFAYNQGLKESILTVNAENEKAIQLYLKEGFKKVNVVICYGYNINEVK